MRKPSSITTISITKQIAIHLTKQQQMYCRWQCYMLTKVRNLYISYAWEHYEETGSILSYYTFDKEIFPHFKAEYVDPDGNPMHGQARQDCLRGTVIALKCHAFGSRRNGKYIAPDGKPPYRDFELEPYRHIHFPNTFRYVRLVGSNRIHIPFLKEVKLIDKTWLKASDLQYMTSGDIVWDPFFDKWYINCHLHVPLDYYIKSHPIEPYNPHHLGIGIDLGYTHLMTRTSESRYMPHIDYHPNPMYDDRIRHLTARVNELKRRYFAKIRYNLRKFGYDDAIYRRGHEGKAAILNDINHRGIYDQIFKTKNICKIHAKWRRAMRKEHDYKKNLMRQMAMDLIRHHPTFICMEKIIVSDMRSKKKNFGNAQIRRFATEIPFYSIRESVKWACLKYQINFYLADQYFPSSHRCGLCGHKGYTFGYHSFVCENPACPGYEIERDRDENSADNLFKYGVAMELAEPIDSIYNRFKYVSVAIPHETYFSINQKVKYHSLVDEYNVR